MTVIVALIDKKRKEVYIGADSAGADDKFNLRIRKDIKIFETGDFLVGYTSSFRMGQLLRFNFNPPKQKKEQTNFEYMCTDFIETVREKLKKGGYTKIKENEELGGTFIVIYKNQIYKIDNDFQVAEAYDEYDACGCGEPYALGSLYSSRKLSFQERIIRALKCAEHFSAGVRRPFRIIKKSFEGGK